MKYKIGMKVRDSGEDKDVGLIEDMKDGKLLIRWIKYGKDNIEQTQRGWYPIDVVESCCKILTPLDELL